MQVRFYIKRAGFLTDLYLGLLHADLTEDTRPFVSAHGFQLILAEREKLSPIQNTQTIHHPGTSTK